MSAETRTTGSIAFSAGGGWLERLNPLAKLAWLLALSLLAFVLPHAAIIALMLALLAGIVLLGRIDLRQLRLGRLLLWMTVLLFALQALFYRAGEPLFYLWPLHGGRWPVSVQGLARGLVVAGRFAIIVFSSQVFVLVTEPSSLAYALMQAHLPYRYGFALVTALRLIPVFETEATTVYQAQLVRGVRYDAYQGPRRTFALLRQFMLPMLISALRKVDALAISMEGRMFGRYPTRTYVRRSRWTRADALALGALALFLIGTILLHVTLRG